jgi:signal transduction histidine kinase
MTAETFLGSLTQILYVISFGVTVQEAIRRPRRVTIDAALLFGDFALLATASLIVTAFHLHPSDAFNTVQAVLILGLPYLLLRLVDDVAGASRWLLRIGAAVFVLTIALAAAQLAGYPGLRSPAVLVLIADFIGLEIYAAVCLVREAARAVGTTRRRLRSAALGSLALGLFLLFLCLSLIGPPVADAANALAQVALMGSGLGYLFGFAPPAWIRRQWQMPDVLAFLGRTAVLPQLSDEEAILAELENGMAAAVGASRVAIALWDEARHRLEPSASAAHPPQAASPVVPEVTVDLQTRAEIKTPNERVLDWIFGNQKPLFVEDIAKFDPTRAEVDDADQATSLLGVPLVAGDRRLGVVLAYAQRPGLFVEDDLALLQILANQAAVILQSRVLIEQAMRTRAREETARLKEDFFSAAAHDLRTPLTALLGQVQLLHRRARARPDAPIDLPAIQRLETQALRLRRLTDELLDVTRAEQGSLVGERQLTDLAALAREVAAASRSTRHPVSVDGEPSVVASLDPVRLKQLLENLVENAIKYTPDGGDVRVSVWQDAEAAHLTVRDQGIGIPANEVPHIFEQFFRATNVNDRQFAGLGVGLYLCRRIAEGHGGQITAESGLGKGTTIHVSLPRNAASRGAPS